MTEPGLAPSLTRSLYRPVSKDAVLAEYTEASRAAQDYARAKWGSAEGMRHRFELGLSTIRWNTVRRWLDIGCGTGAWFALAESRGRRFDELIGVDLALALLEHAARRPLQSPVRWIPADLEAMPSSCRGVDLVTLLGVLQQCGTPPRAALAAATDCLRPGGQLFFTTKHLGWIEFTGGRLTPDPGHSWFDAEELLEIVRSLDLAIIETNGFLPREARIVPREQSHTIYVLAVKNSERTRKLRTVGL